MTRVLVTGATGFIGRPATAVLEARGWDVRATSSSDTDLLDPDATRALLERTRPTHLLHLAWHHVVGDYWTAEENRDWVAAGLALLEAFADLGGRRAVMAGTCAEYEWGVGRCSESATPLRPATLYGRCKHELHQRATLVAERAGVSLAWARLFFLYGPGEDGSRLVPAISTALLAGREAPCTEGLQRRDFLYVDDAAAGFADLLAATVEGPVNLGSGDGTAVRDVVAAVGSATGRAELIRYGALPAREGDPDEVVADVTRLREEVGFTPQVGVEEGVARAVDWWRR
jgi:nucleoside-diphosphate-sugar epimerase